MTYKPILFFRVFFVVAAMLFSLSVVAKETTPEGDASEAEESNPPIGLSGIELKEEEEGIVPKKERFILPPYISEKTETTTFRAVLPLFYFKERKGEGARKDFGLLPFYWSYDEGKAHARVYFPFYWKFRTPKFDTDIVLQTYYKRTKQGFGFGFAPVLFMGKDKKEGKSYQVILPPLFWNFRNKDGGFTWAIWYYDYREKDNFKRGIPPLFFSSRKRGRTVTTVIPPLFWHVNDDVNYRTTTVLPPLFFRTRENGWSAGLLPIFYFARDKAWSRNMVLPFYYGATWGEKKQGRSHYFPLLLSYTKKSPKLSQGGIAVFYHWYKEEGDYLNMYSPLFWRYGNTRTGDRRLLVPPLFYRKDSPVTDDTMIGLVYWNFHEHHKEKTFAIAPFFAHNRSLYEERWRTWVIPTFDFGKQPDGYHARLHPIFYLGKNKKGSHFVFAPIFWRFNTEKDRNTVFFPLWWNFYDKKIGRLRRVAFPLWWHFTDEKRKIVNKIAFPLYWDFHNMDARTRTILGLPLFWRVQDAHSAHTGVLNVGIHKGEKKKNRFWTFRLFPFVSFGKPPSPEGVRWDFLSGLFGWRRQGTTKELKLFWIPIPVGESDQDELEK